MSPSPERALALDALLRDLGPRRLRRGGLVPESPGGLVSGVQEIDRLLGGGFPRGRLSEICGGASSGRTSLALTLLARTYLLEAVDVDTLKAGFAALDQAVAIDTEHYGAVTTRVELDLACYGYEADPSYLDSAARGVELGNRQ